LVGKSIGETGETVPPMVGFPVDFPLNQSNDKGRKGDGSNGLEVIGWKFMT